MQLRFLSVFNISMAICCACFNVAASAQPDFGPNRNAPGAPGEAGANSSYPPDLVQGNLPAAMPAQTQYRQINPNAGQAYPNAWQGYPGAGQTPNGGYAYSGSYSGSPPSQTFAQGPPLLPPAQQAAQGQFAAAPQKVSPQQSARVYQWFLKYDEIRRRAQMNPIEKQQADGMLARGLGLFMPGQDKMAARQLLSLLVMRYQTATQSLAGLPVLVETKQLQEAYYQYFDTAAHLFSDYLKVQENVFAVDNNGQSIAKQLIQRKLMLENLEHACKDLDGQTRHTFGVPAYQY